MPGLALTFRIAGNNLPAMVAGAKAELSKAVQETAEAIVAEAKIEIEQGAKSGRIYKVSKTGAPHQASAEGEAPATEAGDLVNSRIVEMEDGATQAEAVFSSEHAAPLEFGTVRMAPRPFLGPAVESQEAAFADRCRAALAAGIAKGSRP